MVDPLLAAQEFDETPDLYGAFPDLSEGQIATLVPHGDCRMTEVGDVLYREGDLDYDFVVLLEGKVAVIEGYEGPEPHVVGVHGPRRFLGEISLLTGQAAFVTAVVVEPGQVLVVPVERLRQLVLQDTALSDLILRAYLQRRSILIEVGAGFRILGSCYSPDTRRLRELPHAAGCHIASSTSIRTTRPRRCCASSASGRRRRQSSSGVRIASCAIRAMPSWPE